MKEKSLGELAKIFKRPEGLDDFEKAQLLAELSKTGDLKVWGDAFKVYWDTRERLQRGDFCNIWDPRRLHSLGVLFDRAFGSDSDMFLKRWKEVQDRKRFPQST